MTNSAVEPQNDRPAGSTEPARASLRLLLLVAGAFAGSFAIVALLGSLAAVLIVGWGSGQAQQPDESSQPAPKVSLAPLAADQIEFLTGAQPVNLLTKFDITRHTTHGNAHLDQWKLFFDAPDMMNMVMLPVHPPENYELESQVTELERKCFFLGIFVKGRPCMVTIDGWTNNPRTMSAVDMIDGKRPGYDGFVGQHDGPLLTKDQPATVICRVVSNQVTVLVNGKKVFEWSGDPARLSLHPAFQVPHPKAMFIGSYEARYRVDKLELRPLPTRTGLPNPVPALVAQEAKPNSPGIYFAMNNETPPLQALQDRIRLAVESSVNDGSQIRLAPLTPGDNRLRILRTGTSQQRRNLGKALGCKVVLCVEGPALPLVGTSLHVAMCETRFGLPLLNESVPVSRDFDADCRRTIELINQGLERYRQAPQQICCVEKFTAGTNSQAPDWLPGALTQLENAQLRHFRRVTVVDGETVSSIQEEPADKKSSTPLRFVGEYWLSKEPGSTSMRITLKLLRGPQQIGLQDRTVKQLSEVSEFLGEASWKLLSEAGLAANVYDRPPESQALGLELRKDALAKAFAGDLPAALEGLEAAALALPRSAELRGHLLTLYEQQVRVGPRRRWAFLRAIEHLEEYLEWGGTDVDPRRPLVRDETGAGTAILSLRLMADRQGRPDAGLDSPAQADAEEARTRLRRIILVQTQGSRLASFYFSWLVCDRKPPEILQEALLLTASLEHLPYAAAQLKDCLTSCNLPGRLAEVEGGPEFLEKLRASRNAGMSKLAEELTVRRNPSAAKTPESAPRVSEPARETVPVDSETLTFRRWTLRSGRSAELSFVRREGNLVVFQTRSGDVRELPWEDLCDADRLLAEGEGTSGPKR